MPMAEHIQEALQDGYRMLEPVFLDFIERKCSMGNSA